HTGMDQPGGPSIQRWISFGSVCACHTSVRGAAKSRVTRTCVSLGRDTCAFSIVLTISVSLMFDHLVEVLVVHLHAVGHAGGDGGVARFLRPEIHHGGQRG